MKIKLNYVRHFLLIKTNKKDGKKRVTEFIHPIEYTKHMNLNEDERITVEFSEPNLDPDAMYIRISLLIRGMRDIW